MSTAFFPLDLIWGLSKSAYSDEMSKRMVWLSGVVPYDQCQAVFDRIGEQLVPSSSIWRQTQRHGERFQAYESAQQAHVSVERVILPSACHDHTQQKGISLDGGMVSIRHEGWKEFKMGTVFDVDIRLERDSRTNELVDRPHAHHISYTAVLGTVDQFAPAMWALALEHEVPTAIESSVTADGAEWIWNLVADLFPARLQIID